MSTDKYADLKLKEVCEGIIYDTGERCGNDLFRIRWDREQKMIFVYCGRCGNYYIFSLSDECKESDDFALKAAIMTKPIGDFMSLKIGDILLETQLNVQFELLSQMEYKSTPSMGWFEATAKNLTTGEIHRRNFTRGFYRLVEKQEGVETTP